MNVAELSERLWDFASAKTNWIDIDSLIRVKNRIDHPRHQEDVRVLREVKRQRNKKKRKK